MTKQDDSPHLSSAALLADILDKLDEVLASNAHLASLGAQSLVQIDRSMRLNAANQQLGARERMEFEQILSRFKREFALMGHAQREPSRTIVTDIVKTEKKTEELTIESESSRSDEISVVFFRLPFTKKVRGIPNKWLRYIGTALASSSLAAGFVHLLHQWGVLK